MHLKQFRYGEGNLAYLIHEGASAAVIDGGAVDEILQFVKEHSLALQYVLNTHDHADHTPGNKNLLRATQAQFLTTGELTTAKTLELGGEVVTIFPTPGHTMDSIVYSCDDWMITGDTLFNGTVGNCYSGNYEVYFSSLGKILSYPPSTSIFAGHDLVDYALGVAENIDPANPHLKEYRAAYDPDCVVSTLEMELNVNPFIRFDDTTLDSYRATIDQAMTTPYERWRAMMTIH